MKAYPYLEISCAEALTWWWRLLSNDLSLQIKKKYRQKIMAAILFLKSMALGVGITFTLERIAFLTEHY